MQLVYEVMTREVQSISARDTVRRAAQMMDDLNVGALPVCEGERLIGMVTDRDITVRATSAGLNPDDALVEQVMSTDVRSCFEDQSLEEVAQQMAATRIRRIPVLSHDDRQRLVGIVSLGDIATKAAGGARRHVVEQVVEKVSFPSEPDLSPQGRSAGDADDTAGGSDTGTATGLAGSDVLRDRLNPDYEVSATADPGDVVEVTPAQLVNRNAPGSTTLSNPTVGAAGNGDAPVVVRRQAGAGDDAPADADETDAVGAAGASGASGGTAGAAGPAGSAAGAGPQG